MNSAQRTAFFEGTGSQFQASELLIAIQGIGVTLLLIYVAWALYSAYSEFGNGSISASDMTWSWARNVFMLTFLIYIIVG